jgi:hypothetical protein
MDQTLHKFSSNVFAKAHQRRSKAQRALATLLGMKYSAFRWYAIWVC